MADILLAVNGVVCLLGSDNSVGWLNDDCQGDNSRRRTSSKTHSLIFNDSSEINIETLG
jgi:hypothetical protein